MKYSKFESDIKTFDDLEYVCDGEDEETFSFRGLDYIIIHLNAYGHYGWFLCDFETYYKKGITKKAYKPLSEDFLTFHDLANAPILEGKSIKERMKDGTVVFFEPVKEGLEYMLEGVYKRLS